MHGLAVIGGGLTGAFICGVTVGACFIAVSVGYTFVYGMGVQTGLDYAHRRCAHNAGGCLSRSLVAGARDALLPAWATLVAITEVA